MSWISDIGGWLSDNKGVIGSVVGTGLNAINQYNKDESQSQYLEYLRQREDKNYQDQVAQINAYNAQLAAAGSGGGGGGGSRGNGAAAAAARKTEANRMKASKKANKISQESFKKIIDMYAPLAGTVNELLPLKTDTYKKSLGMQNAMSQYLAQPGQMAKLDAAGPAWNVNIPLPDLVRIK